MTRGLVVHVGRIEGGPPPPAPRGSHSEGHQKSTSRSEIVITHLELPLSVISCGPALKFRWAAGPVPECVVWVTLSYAPSCSLLD